MLQLHRGNFMNKANEYLTNKIRNNNASYNGPKSLFKYRPFDDYTFDMFKNNYVYLCQAEKLDDPSECMTELKVNDLYDYEKNHLKPKCIEQIFDMIVPYTNEDTHNQVKSMLNQIINQKGTIYPKDILELTMYIQPMYPNTNLAPLVNYIANIPELLDKPEIDEQFKTFLAVAMEARQKLGICSLSETENNKEMWNNYANNNSGYCIEYDVSDYEFNKDILPVVYKDDRNCDVITQLINMFINDMIYNFSDKQIKTDISQYISLFVTKNLIWEYQKEWRLIGNADEKAKAPKIKNIYLGYNVSSENEKRIHNYFKDTDVNIIKMTKK